MRLKINLAQRPFYNRKLFWLSFLVVMGLLFLASQWSMEKLDQAQNTTRRLQKDIAKQEIELKALQAQKPPPVQTLSDKQIQEIEAAAELIQQRRFSWTRLMEEFEQSLPKEIRIISINPRKDSKTEDISLSVKVYAKSVDYLTQMIAKMDKEGIFLVHPTNQEVPVQNGDIGFALNVTYKPRTVTGKLVKKVEKTDAKAKRVVNQGDDDDE